MKNQLQVLCIFIIISISSKSQISYRGQVLSNSITISDNIPTLVLPVQDPLPYHKEDAIKDKYKDNIWRFGINIPVNIDIKQSAEKEKVKNGYLFRYRIYSEGAISINFRFSKYHIPKGAKLFVYNDTKTEVLGAFTSQNNKKTGILGISLIFSDAITIEYFEPENPEFKGELVIDRITHGYRNAAIFAEKAYGSSGNCNNDVVCPVAQGWEDQINSVAMIVSGGNGFCTGAMINNSALDGTPYFLTANHCYANPADWVFWFNWHKTTCETSSGSGTASNHDDISGATLKARFSDSDFCLLELSTAPPASYNVYFAGWDRRDIPSQSSCGIHHPSGDVKKISFDYDSVSSYNYLGNGVPDSHWKVSTWDDGTTEGGSSGSPLFNQNHKIVGQLHGGYASCSNNGADVYGKLSMSWEGGGSPSSQLKYWLEPCGYDIDTLEGFYPQTHNLDAQLKKILSPQKTYCGEDTVDLIVVVKNLGTDNLTSCTINYSIDTENSISYNWTGNLATSETDTLTLTQFYATEGNHTIKINLHSPNGSTDEVLNSNVCNISFDVDVSSGIPLPYIINFEDTIFPPNNIFVENPDNAKTWERNINASGNNNSTAAAYIKCIDYNNNGAQDILSTPKLNLITVNDAILTFNVAYRRYNNNYYERLIVKVSDDCGINWHTVYNKTSSNLATGSDQTSAFVPTQASDWRMDTVNLSSYYGKNIIIKFINVNGYGNNIYLDDIKVNSNLASSNNLKIDYNIIMFPNPATNKLNIQNSQIIYNIIIYDITGKIILNKNYNRKNTSIDISGLSKGVYFVKINSNNFAVSKKIIVD